MTCERTFFQSGPSKSVYVRFKDNFFKDSVSQKVSGNWRELCASEIDYCKEKPYFCNKFEMKDITVGDLSASCTFLYGSSDGEVWYVKQIYDFERKTLSVITDDAYPVSLSEMYNETFECN